jgi:hypothetical protein
MLVLSGVLLLSLSAGSASALNTHVFSSAFGSPGSGAGQVSSPQGVAVNDATGDVYVADTRNARIDEFSPSSGFVRAWGWGVADGASSFETCTVSCQAGVSGNGAGQFESPAFVAVDNDPSSGSFGDVYVADTEDNLVQKFDAAGSLETGWGDGGAGLCGTAKGELSGACATNGPFGGLAGVAVDASGSLWVYDTNSNVFEFSQAGSFAQTWNSGVGAIQAGIAVDASDNVYLVTGSGNLEQFASTGSPVGGVSDDTGDAIAGVAVDPGTGDVYADDGGHVIRYYPASELATCVAASNCVAADTFGISNLSGSAAGIAVDGSHDAYAADAVAGDVTVFAPAVVPTVTTGSASNVEPFGVTLSGSLDPAGGGNVTSCEFQYIDDADYQASAADPYSSGQTVACSPSAPYAAATAVSAGVSGLQPNTTYHFRVQASNGNDGDGQDQTFTTPQAVLTGQPSNVTGTGATLNGTADPGGTSISSCQFEYVEAAHFNPQLSDPYSNGQTAACTPSPSGTGAVAITAQITGLRADTIYHYRLEFTNPAGTWTGDDQSLFMPGTPAGPAPSPGTPGLPDGRAYEQVSPVNKNGNPAGATVLQGATPNYAVAAPDGSSLFYSAAGGSNFGANSNGCQQASVSSRSTEGWTTRGVLPPFNGSVTCAPGVGDGSNLLPSADNSQLAIGSSGSLGSAPAGQLDLVGADQSSSWLSQPQISDPLSAPVYRPPRIAGASPDLGRIYFSYRGTLLPADDQGNPAFGGASRNSVISAGDGYDFGFYEWSRSGGLTYAGVLPDGSIDPYGAAPAAIGASNATGAYFYNPQEFSYNEVSADGSKALFVSASSSAPLELYDRETAADGSQKTVLISRSAVTGQPAADSPPQVSVPWACPFLYATVANCGAPYAYGSPDGSHVLFADVDALTADAPDDGSVKEYEYDTSTDTLSYLAGFDDQLPCGGPSQPCYFSPILDGTADASELLFFKETRGGDSVDLWSAGRITPVAQFPDPDGANGPYLIPEARVNQDGSAIVFETDSPIYTTAPGEFNNSGGFEQVYRYVVATGELSCLSCGATGLSHTGNANMTNSDNVSTEPGVAAAFWAADERAVSSDGGRVFFDSPDQLVPQASNGKRNVYEWEAAGDGSCPSAQGGGCLYLISTGQSAGDDFFLDNSTPGNDIFFATTQGLVPQDTDGGYDVYDARVGGGFRASGAAPCSGDSCQGAVTGAPALPSGGSLSFSGPGDTSPPASARTFGLALRAVRGARFTLSLKLPAAGWVAVSGADVRTVRARRRTAGACTLTVSLSSRGKRLLERRHRLRVVLTVRYMLAEGGTQSASLTLLARV